VFLLALELNTSRLQVCRVIVRCLALFDSKDEKICGSDDDDDVFGATAMSSSFLRFLDHAQRRTTVGRTPLDE